MCGKILLDSARLPGLKIPYCILFRAALLTREGGAGESVAAGINCIFYRLGHELAKIQTSTNGLRR